MKLAILFCLVAFVCVAHASPAVVNRADEAEERGAIVEAAKEKLELAKEKLDSLIQKASDVLKQKINDAKKMAEDLAEKLKSGALKASDKIYESLQKILDKFDNTVLNLEQYANDAGVDVSECSKMTQTVRQAIMATIANSSACIVEKIETGKALVVDLTRISQEALDELDQVKQDGGVCLENISGVKAIVSATACMGKSAVKASWAVTKKIPFVAWDLTKITTLLNTLPQSIGACMAKNSALTAAQEATNVLGSFKECVSEKMVNAGVGSIKDNIPDAVAEQYNKIQDTINENVNKIPDVVGEHINEVPDVVGGHVDKIPEIIGNEIQNAVREYANNLPVFG